MRDDAEKRDSQQNLSRRRLFKLHLLNAVLCRISDISVKRVPSVYEEESDDIQISSAVTVFRDSLDLAVDSIVLVSLGTVVGFLMNTVLLRQTSLTSDTKTFLAQAQDPDSAVVSLVPVTFNAESKNRLLRGSYLASIEHKERRRTFLRF